jgi:hypothetical protein
MTTRRVLVALVGAAALVAAGEARAELVVLSTGRVMSVKAARIDGLQARLVLRGGGELVCDVGLIAEVRPDEVPWPEAMAPGEVAASVPIAAAKPFAHLIEPLSRDLGVDPGLVHAVVAAESGYTPSARSRKGALGLMQLMPVTARQYGVTDPLDPEANLAAGIRHLRSLLDRFDLRLALAAYNAGEAAVRRYGGVPPYPETRAYVDRILREVSARGGGLARAVGRTRESPTRTPAPRS